MGLPQIPQRLVGKLRDGSCVLFVGAGLSKGAGLPDWQELLKRMVNWSEANGTPVANRAELIDLINKGGVFSRYQRRPALPFPTAVMA